VARKRTQSLPVREQLEALAHHYLRVHNEIARTRVDSSARRKLEQELLDVRERFDRLLEEWVDDDQLCEQWREHLHTHTPAPDEPEAVEPLLFRGENDAGSIAEVRGEGDELQVLVDGSLLERVEAKGDLASRVPGLTFHVDGFDFRETFAAPPEALRALGDFLDDGRPPPWEHAADLFADGPVDVHFDLTARGRRALAR
jgi:hypothetical protein